MADPRPLIGSTSSSNFKTLVGDKVQKWRSKIDVLHIHVVVVPHASVSDADYESFLSVLRTQYASVDLYRLRSNSSGALGPRFFTSPATTPKVESDFNGAAIMDIPDNDSIWEPSKFFLPSHAADSTIGTFVSRLGSNSTVMINYLDHKAGVDELKSELSTMMLGYRVFGALGVASPPPGTENKKKYVEEISSTLDVSSRYFSSYI